MRIILELGLLFSAVTYLNWISTSLCRILKEYPSGAKCFSDEPSGLSSGLMIAIISYLHGRVIQLTELDGVIIIRNL